MTRARPTSIPRTGALVALGALAVHQLRYLAAYGSDTGHQLAHQGHGYLFSALPVVAGFAAAALAACVLRSAVAGMPNRTRSAGPLLYALAIVSVFSCQELMEGAFSEGHAVGLGAVFAHGGWLAVPLALVIGWTCSALDRGVRRLENLAAGARGRRVRRSRPEATVGRPHCVLTIPRIAAPLAFGIARRPPPIPAR
jgi:hypothetical protein